MLEITFDTLGVGVAEESHLQRVGLGEDSDQDCFIRSETFHRFAEGVRVMTGVALRGCSRIVAG